MKDLQGFASKYAYIFLTYSLAITFIWFGLLKIIGSSPVSTIIYTAVPQLVSSVPGFILILGLAEVLLGAGLLIKKVASYAGMLLVLHLAIASLTVLLTQGFSPSFPFLSLEGEFVVKNLVLLAGLFTIIGHKK